MGLVACGTANFMPSGSDKGLDVPKGAPAVVVQGDDAHYIGMVMSLPIKWNQNLGVNAGTGVRRIGVLWHEQVDGPGTVTRQLQLCEYESPVYETLSVFGAETYQMRYAVPEDVRFQVVLRHQEPMATLEKLILPMGLRMESPERTVLSHYFKDWLPYAIDLDGDGLPGFSLKSRSDEGFRFPFTNVLRTQRASAFSLAAKWTLKLSPTQKKRRAQLGVVDMWEASDRSGMKEMILGCTHEDRTACTDAEVHLLNSFVPTPEAQGSGRYFWRYLTDAKAHCEYVSQMMLSGF
jgi:hypothetical protein